MRASIQAFASLDATSMPPRRTAVSANVAPARAWHPRGKADKAGVQTVRRNRSSC